MRFFLSSPFQKVDVPTILIALAIMLLVGFLFTRLTKPLKLPNVTAYILTGVVLGPLMKVILGESLFPEELRTGMDFITDISLSFIAFGVGRFFKFSMLKKSGPKIFIISLFDTILAAVIVFGAMMLMNLLPNVNIDIKLALLLASIASATAPASTMMTIRQTGSKGDFVDTILQVLSLDNAISLILFSISLGLITSGESTGVDFFQIIKPVLLNLLLVVVGFILGIVLYHITPEKRTKDNRLILLIALLLAFAGLASLLEISPLLGVMAMGMAYTNKAKDESLFRQLDSISPPILTLFFVLSGMRLQLDSLASIGIIGVVYFLTRIIGKYGGASLGSVVAKSTENNKKYLGLALIPQASVSIGLAALGSRILSGYGYDDFASMLTTIIVSAGVLYEIFGPPAAKFSLGITGSYTESRKVKIIGPEPEAANVNSEPQEPIIKE